MQVLMQESAHEGISVTFELHHNCLAIGDNQCCSIWALFLVSSGIQQMGKLHHCTTLSDATGCSTNLPQKGLLFMMDIRSKFLQNDSSVDAYMYRT
jgi:hypothetical protein